MSTGPSLHPTKRDTRRLGLLYLLIGLGELWFILSLFKGPAPQRLAPMTA
ncbi:MAG TPA: hypothetical protein VLA96_04470 [Terriglobales bacterium]|nr:hypothetical protein [Terriglobales bacterium]